MFETKIMSVFIAFTLLASLSSAVTVQSDVGSEKFEEAMLLNSSKVSVSEKENFNLPLVSYGLRKKPVFGLVPVRVYVLQLLAAQPSKLVKSEDEFLNSLKAAGPTQLHFTFLRDIPGSKISDAFKDGLEANKINVKKLSPEMEQVLKEISNMNEFKNGDTFSASVVWKEKQATIHLQDPKGAVKTIAGSEEFAEQFLSIWFGKASDGKLKELKKALIK